MAPQETSLTVWHDDTDGVPVVLVGCSRCYVTERWSGYRGAMLQKSLDAAQARHSKCAAVTLNLMGRAAE